MPSTYRGLFRTPEFTPLFATASTHVAASTVSGLALGTLVYTATGSPLLAAFSMFGPSLAQVVGATALLSAADRLPPRAAMTSLSVTFGLGTAVLAVPGLPLWAVFAVIMFLGLAGSVGGGVRFGLLSELLSGEGYLLGRSVLNMSVGVMQIGGFAAGGALVAVLSPRGTLLAGAALYLATALVARFGLSRRPARAAGRPSITATWRTNAWLWSSPPRRYIYLALWVPNGLIVGCEALFVPYSPQHAGLLFAFAGAGMLLGDTATGRFVPPAWRRRLAAPLLLLLAAPYLVFAAHPPFGLAVAVITLASIGYSASLLLQDHLMALTPRDVHGQALGLHSAGMVTMQGVGATLAGTVAQYVSSATAMAVMAAGSITVTLLLTPGLRGKPRTIPEQPSGADREEYHARTSAPEMPPSVS
ncbi:MFS transporter [Actinomadura formosensis]|uniref:MFS transporter n=1 Tax=Actinomadura formosensis TaxID=60706 RepID=UPI00082EAFFB|nr:MFS transporter [Actinomadura formosensis]